MTSSSPKSPSLNRRDLAKVAGAGAAFALFTNLRANGAVAQDATPAATPTLDSNSIAQDILGPAVPPEISDYAQDWPTYHGNLAATRATTSTTISRENVATLGVAWNFPITTPGGFGAVTANPVVIGDTVYIQDMQSNVYALDRATGTQKWRTDYDITQVGGPNGVAVGYGLVFGSSGGDGKLFALDAATGEEVWRVQLTNNPSESVGHAPAIFDSIVYASTFPNGAGGGAYKGGTKGIIYALNARTGATLWQWDTTAGTESGNLWGQPRVNSGGGVWYPFSFDDEGHIYFAVGNPAPFPGSEQQPEGSSRPGDNDYTNCMVSLDLTTGEIRWYRNYNPHDLFDLDFQNTPVVATVEIDGTSRKLAIGSGKIGIVAAVDADSGEEIWVASVGLHENDTLQDIPSGETVIVYPGLNGGVQTPIAYADSRVFVPVNNESAAYTETGQTSGGDTWGTGSGEFIALDAATGEQLWANELPNLAVGGATVANDVVFTGSVDGIFRAYDVETGDELWTYTAPAGINATPAIAGDLVILPVAGPFFTENPPTPVFNIIAFAPGASSELIAATPEAAASPAAAVADDATIVSFVDIAFEPSEITVPGNTDVPFHFVNNGVLLHNFKIDSPEVFSGDLGPNETADVIVNLAPGTYEFYCTIQGHKDAGMVGTLTVTGV